MHVARARRRRLSNFHTLQNIQNGYILLLTPYFLLYQLPLNSYPCSFCIVVVVVVRERPVMGLYTRRRTVERVERHSQHIDSQTS
jgi:hypothetical protein